MLPEKNCLKDLIKLIQHRNYLIGGPLVSSSEQFSTEIVGGTSIEWVVDATYKFLNGCGLFKLFFFFFPPLFVADSVEVEGGEAVSSSTFNELGGEVAKFGLQAYR